MNRKRSKQIKILLISISVRRKKTHCSWQAKQYLNCYKLRPMNIWDRDELSINVVSRGVQRTKGVATSKNSIASVQTAHIQHKSQTHDVVVASTIQWKTVSIWYWLIPISYFIHDAMLPMTQNPWNPENKISRVCRSLSVLF